MFDSPLKEAVEVCTPRRSGSPFLPWVIGLNWLFILMASVCPVYGFDSYETFEKSKKQSLPIKLSALTDKERVHSGENFWMYVMVVLDKGWHMYSLEKQSKDETVATRIELEGLVFNSEGDWEETPPKLVHDDVMDKVMKTHSGQVEFSRLFSVPKDLRPGVYPVSGTLRFRSCDNRICSLPRQERFQTRVIVEAGEPG